MLLLTSTSDIVRVVTGAATAIEVHASYADNNAGTITPLRTNTSISTATTTTIVAAPASGVQRNVRGLYITNNGAAASQVEVQHFDGANSAELIGVTLLPGENLVLDETGEWHHHDTQGAEYGFTPPATGNLGPFDGANLCLGETIPRALATTNTTPGATGTLFLQAIYLTAGTLVSKIGIISATTAANTPTNRFHALYDANRNLLAQSANQTTTAWGANTVANLAMTTPYRIPVSGLYYIGLLQVATTIATVHGGPAKANAIVSSTPPIMHGTSSTGLTTTLPSPAAAITAGTASIYAWVN
jgi:hypothetical protein